MGPDPARGVPFDEERDARGHLRPAYERVLQALATTDLEELSAAVERQLADNGVTFGTQAFVVDPVPRLIAAEEWASVERGLTQRTRALNHFLTDVYRERRIVSAGIVDAETIDGAEGYEPDLRGRLTSDAPPAPIIGFDLVRDPEGRFLVLEDNLRTPSGIAYLVAARAALAATLPAGLPRPRPVDPVIYELLGATLRAAAPPGAGPDPVVVLVSDGPGNVAYYEHSCIARALGIELATPDQLHADGGRLCVSADGEDPRPVDVVYRRTDEDRVRDEHGQLTTIGELLVAPWLAGQIGLVNAFGNGVADDKLVHSHVEDFVRFYLEEEPLIASVPTRALDTPEAGRDAIERLPELVIKPRHGHGGTGVTIGSHADESQLATAREELERHPERYIAQPIVPLSRHPTVVDGRLQPRHLDLRPFAFFADDVALAPGGLSRVAFDADEMVVNSSRNGGGKDTWILD
jgi:uncharacterized circularly permuted ATP-grasp superfamily protein